ncbi:putative zinc-binding protein [Desulfosporosinus sp. FKB]|uniref:putative zinc-binding protein n=1 Tax=Desulfosporosinus sp. FKB TaxID=1969835 RepID=UPI0032B72D00
MSINMVKVGVVSCSGEDCLGGTISRLATRKMLDEIRPDTTVTICLPLFLAGGVEERGFAEKFPTISVDGCSKACAKRATEKYSGKVSAAIDVSDFIGKEVAEAEALSIRNLTDEHSAMVEKVVSEITVKFDEVLRAAQRDLVAKGLAMVGSGPSGGCGCGCGTK